MGSARGQRPQAHLCQCHRSRAVCLHGGDFGSALRCFLDTETGDLHSIGCVRNIDEMKGKELLLQEKAERDLLTGLYNKVTAQLLIENATHFTAEKPTDGAFLLIDVDNFKHVNDTLGHAGGDEVLVKVAAGLLALFRTGDIVGRVGATNLSPISILWTTRKSPQKRRRRFARCSAGSSSRPTGRIGSPALWALRCFPHRGITLPHFIKMRTGRSIAPRSWGGTPILWWSPGRRPPFPRSRLPRRGRILAFPQSRARLWRNSPKSQACLKPRCSPPNDHGSFAGSTCQNAGAYDRWSSGETGGESRRHPVGTRLLFAIRGRERALL